MAEIVITLDVRTRDQWRRWLAKHHASSPGVWLVLYWLEACGAIKATDAGWKLAK